MRRRRTIAILIFIILSGILFLTYKNKNTFITGDKELDKIYNKNEIKKDREQMIKILEDVHPVFLEDVPNKYYEAKERYIEETKDKMSLAQFQLATSRYTSSLEDGHTGIGWIGAKFLDVNWKYINGDLVILDKDNKPTTKIVTSINNIEIDNVLKSISETFPSENYVDEYMNYTNLSKERLILKSAGIDTNKKIMVGVKDKDIESEIEVKFKENQDHNKFEVYAKNIKEDTMYIKLEICDDNVDLEKVKYHIKKNLDKTKYVIIDVRDNPGGYSGANDKIFEALKIKTGYFGGVERYSKEVNDFYENKPKEGSQSFERSNHVVKNENIELYVLMNENTYSSAKWLATVVSDGEIGTVVGKPSRNTPSSYGNAIPFKLDNTNIQGQLSFTKWLRPDQSKDKEKVLDPDIKVEEGEDALDKTLEIIKAKE